MEIELPQSHHVIHLVENPDSATSQACLCPFLNHSTAKIRISKSTSENIPRSSTRWISLSAKTFPSTRRPATNFALPWGWEIEGKNYPPSSRNWDISSEAPHYSFYQEKTPSYSLWLHRSPLTRSFLPQQHRWQNGQYSTSSSNSIELGEVKDYHWIEVVFRNIYEVHSEQKIYEELTRLGYLVTNVDRMRYGDRTFPLTVVRSQSDLWTQNSVWSGRQSGESSPKQPCPQFRICIAFGQKLLLGQLCLC